MNDRMIWRVCCGLVIAIALLTFTPVITPKGISKPTLWGMPYTLWMGIVQAFVLVGLTLVGTLVHPGNKEK